MAKSVYLNIKKTDIKLVTFTDKQTGEKKAFWNVTVPKGTEVNGKNISFYRFSPKFVNESKYMGEEYVDIPLLEDREQWLTKNLWDSKLQKPIVGEDGKQQKDVVKVMPDVLKKAFQVVYRQQDDVQIAEEAEAQEVSGASSSASSMEELMKNPEITF